VSVSLLVRISPTSAGGGGGVIDNVAASLLQNAAAAPTGPGARRERLRPFCSPEPFCLLTFDPNLN
jgi:hypothetical protein